MAKTLENLRTHARTYLDEVSEADWSDAQIDRELNYAYMEMYTAVIETYEDYYLDVSEADLTSDQQRYAVPSDFYKLKRLEIKYRTSDNRRKATPIDYMSYKQQIDRPNVGSQTVPTYQLLGEYIYLTPVPDEAVTNGLYLMYIKTISEMTANADTISIPFADRYARYIVLGACAQLLRKGQQEESVALQYQNDFQIGLEKMKQELEDRYLDGVKRIIETDSQWLDFGNVPPFGTIGNS